MQKNNNFDILRLVASLGVFLSMALLFLTSIFLDFLITTTVLPHCLFLFSFLSAGILYFKAGVEVKTF